METVNLVLTKPRGWVDDDGKYTAYATGEKVEIPRAMYDGLLKHDPDSIKHTVGPVEPSTGDSEQTADDDPDTPDEPTDDNPLPADLPGRDALFEAGYTDLDSVAAVAKLTNITGIGDATAKKIDAYLAG